MNTSDRAERSVWLNRTLPTAVVAAIVVLALVGWWAARESGRDRTTVALMVASELAASMPVDRTEIPAPLPLAAFGSPSGSMERDLELLHEAFETWRTNFPADGNPVGDNAEIVRALAGDNPHALVLLPPDHPSIGADGTLRDRWGMPLFFHQLSGHAMEIRSAGPDRRFRTDDDIVWRPGTASNPDSEAAQGADALFADRTETAR